MREPKKSYNKKPFTKHGDDKRKKKPYKTFLKKSYSKLQSLSFSKTPADENMRLNRFIANAGVCSRREADLLIVSGAVKVNGQVVTQLGTKVLPTDVVQYGNEKLNSEKKVYVLLNKPKDFITTVDDPQERKTVLSLVKNACKERIYPVGRLDRNTTGVLLLTNDGELAKKLTHPKHHIKKIYHVVLSRALSKEDYAKISKGVELEDGMVKVDRIEYVMDATEKNQIGIELHSGKNRVIRRLFESLDYQVIKLDRVSFAGLTKKDIPRGRWRILTPKEIDFLKMIG